MNFLLVSSEKYKVTHY